MSILQSDQQTTSEIYAAWKFEPQWLFEQAPEAILIFNGAQEYREAKIEAHTFL